jgi:hypothetical protein
MGSYLSVARANPKDDLIIRAIANPSHGASIGWRQTTGIAGFPATQRPSHRRYAALALYLNGCYHGTVP